MNAIARDLGKLRHATRDTELDEREVRKLETAASMWDLETIDAWCSILEKVREAGNDRPDRPMTDE